ncbi:MAG: hypothetical protein L0209_08005 [candidate division Zixibacteria bacterium]|nr:hypothetical protein [candidate division Zixibacteria bacterium]
MKLYFYGSNRRETREEIGLGLIAFAVPDIGFVFRSAHKGNALECEHYALLTLCQFVEANAGLFKGQKLEFLGDSTAVVYQAGRPEGSFRVADHSSKDTAISPPAANGASARLLERLRAFKKKIGFSLFWVPLSENRAAEQTVHHPTVKNSPLSEKLNTSFLEAFGPKKNSDPGFSSF